MEKTENKKIGVIVLRVLFTGFLLWSIIFIFKNSGQAQELSSGKSMQVTNYLNGIMAKMGLGYQWEEALVRKLAHFAEFALLGFLMILTLRVYTKRVIAFISWPLLAGLLVAVMDEWYQLYVPGRSSQVTDVLLDFTGVAAGVLTGLLVLLVVYALTGFVKGRQKT